MVEGPTRVSQEVDEPEYAGVASATALRVVAWLYVVGAAIAAIVIYGKFGLVEVPSAYGYTSSVSNPVAGWISVAVFVQGFVTCVLFHAVAAAAENTAEIRSALLRINRV